MKSSLKFRTAAMLASVATTLVMVHALALLGYPAAALATATERIATIEASGESS